MSIILGIDPGSRITGYGVIRQNGRHLQYLGSGCIRTSEKELPGRLKQIYAGVTEIITQFQPDVFAIEQVFMAKNADSALKLGQAPARDDAVGVQHQDRVLGPIVTGLDRKSTRLNSSHTEIYTLSLHDALPI